MKIKDKKILFVALLNIIIAAIDKIILLQQGAWGAPVFLTIILWILIFKRKKYAYYIYGVLCLITILFGILGIFLAIGNLYRGFSPIYSLLMIVLGIDYAVSWSVLRKAQVSRTIIEK